MLFNQCYSTDLLIKSIRTETILDNAIGYFVSFPAYNRRLVGDCYNIGINYVLLNNNFMAYVVIGLISGLLAFLIHGLFDVASIGSKLFVFIWFFAGIICSLKNMNDVQRPS